jgi:hypothetical protein
MMKKLVLIFVLVGLSLYTQAQDVVVFCTRILGSEARIYDVDGSTPLLGTRFYAQIFAVDGTVAAVFDEHGIPLIPGATAKGSPVNFGTTPTSAGYVQTAYPVDTIVSVSASSGVVTLQVRAWSANFGDWNSAYVAGSGGLGCSQPIQVFAGAKTGTPPPVPPSLIGLTGFSLRPFDASLRSVPEPSTIALGVLGLSVLIFRRVSK